MNDNLNASWQGVNATECMELLQQRSLAANCSIAAAMEASASQVFKNMWLGEDMAVMAPPCGNDTEISGLVSDALCGDGHGSGGGGGGNSSAIWWELMELSRKSRFKRFMEDLNIYVTPWIIILGVTGNVLSFLVFSLTHLRRSSSSLYLASLAMVDTGFLLSLLVVWLALVKVPLFHSHGWCQIVVYLNHLCPFLSVWYVVGFTAERYIIVWHPLRKDRFCTPAKAKRIILVITSLGILMYSFTTWTSGVMLVNGHPYCMPYLRYYEVLTVFTSLDTILTLVTPSIIILVLNFRITVKIYQIQKRMWVPVVQASTAPTATTATAAAATAVLVTQGHFVNRKSTLQASISDKGIMHFRFQNRSATDCVVGGVGSVAGGGLSDADLHEAFSQQPTGKPQPEMTHKRSTVVTFRGRSQYRLARMLLIVSSIFVLLNIPSHYFRIQIFMQHLLDQRYKASRKELHWQELFQLVYYLNFAINFFLYSACGRPFRNGLKSLMTRMRHSARRHHCYCQPEYVYK